MSIRRVRGYVRLQAALLLALAPSALWAQHWPAPHAELPSAEQPARTVPTTGYTLSLIWMPERCHARRGDGGQASECSGPQAHRFTLHGLWPDGDGPGRWPQYCRPVAILSDQQIAAGIGDTPSAQLLQHEWAKHGSCVAPDPTRYFEAEDRLFAGLHFPHMGALSRQDGLTVGAFESAFAAANPGMTPQMMRIDVNKRGWLQEVWLCLGKDERPRPCPAGAGGAAPDTPLRIARPSAAPWSADRSRPWRARDGGDRGGA